LTEQMDQERGLKVDMLDYINYMNKHKEISAYQQLPTKFQPQQQLPANFSPMGMLPNLIEESGSRKWETDDRPKWSEFKLQAVVNGWVENRDRKSTRLNSSH